MLPRRSASAWRRRTLPSERTLAGLHVREWGDGQSVLLWHGSDESGDQLRTIAKALAHTWRVVVPDAPGHGRSEPLDSYAPSRVAAQAIELLDGLAVDRTAFVGFSWGARIGCSFAAGYPHRTTALVLLEGGHVDFTDVPGLDLDAAAAGHRGELVEGALAEPLVDTYPALARSGVPILLVSGARDGAFEPLGFDPLRRLQAAVPQVEIRRFPDLGHELTDSAEVASLLREWLTAHRYP